MVRSQEEGEKAGEQKKERNKERKKRKKLLSYDIQNLCREAFPV